MEPLKRQILYSRGKEEPKVKIAGNPIADIIKTGLDVVTNITDKKNRSARIIEWFGSHELINKNGLCEMAGIDTSNFNKLLKAAKIIPEKLLDKIEPIIKEYGYV